MSCIGDSVYRLDHQELFAVKLNFHNNYDSISLAVSSHIERDRILRFLSAWIQWYQLYAHDISTLARNESSQKEVTLHSEEDTLAKKLRRSLDHYLDNVEPCFATLSNSYNSLSDPCSTPHSNAVSPNNSMPGSFPQTKSGKRGFDFSAVNADAVDQLKRNQVLTRSFVSPPSSLTPNTNASNYQDSTIQLKSLIPYPYHDNIPKLFQVLVYYLFKLEANSNEGVFRMAADEDATKQLNSNLNDGCYAAIMNVTSGYLVASRFMCGECEV